MTYDTFLCSFFSDFFHSLGYMEANMKNGVAPISQADIQQKIGN